MEKSLNPFNATTLTTVSGRWTIKVRHESQREILTNEIESKTILNAKTSNKKNIPTTNKTRNI